MKILIAGGAGYLGNILIPKLFERGYLIDVVDLFWFGNHLPPEVKIVNKDILELSVEDLKGYDVVVFLAGLSNDPMAEFAPAKNFVFNAAAPAYLAYIAKQARVRRFIYASSCSVYGFTVNELYDETRPASCGYPYGISKLQGEQAVLQLSTPDFSVIALRKGTVCGYSPRMRFDLIINTMFKSAILNGIITVNNPTIWRPILSIEDAANAYIRAIEANENISGIFNIASANHTVGEIADLVRETLSEEAGMQVGLTIRHLQDFRSYKVSIEKAQNVLSFHPRGSVKTIVRQLIENRELFGDFSDVKFYNIDTLKALERGVRGPVKVKQLAAAVAG